MSISQLKVSSTYPLKKDYILPVQILMCTEGVSNAQLLLQDMEQQPRIGNGEVSEFSTVGGKKAAILLDFGSEFSGGIQLTTRLGSDKQGGMVHIRLGESVAEAMTPLQEKNACNHHSTHDMVVPVPLLSNTEWSQTAYRFAYIELVSPETTMEFTAICGAFTYRDIPYLGTFQCDDKLLEEIYQTSAYTVHLCMQENLWDGVKRDRLVWIGDMHPEMLAIRSVFGHQKVLDDGLRFIAAKDPLPGWPNEMATYAMWYILILWDWYEHNGKIGLLNELRDYWTGLLQNLAALVHAEKPALIEQELQRGFFFDWPTQSMPVPSGAGVHALMAKALEAGVKLCQAVGEQTLAEECSRKIPLLADSGMEHGNMKQVVAMMSLAGHLPKEEAAKLLTLGGGKGMSTFQSYYILMAAAKTAGTQQALAMLKEYYGGMLATGATTFWEDFDLDWLRDGARIDKVLELGEYDIHGDNGRFCYEGLRHSLCHGWSAGPAAFLAENVLGVEIVEPGCRKVRIQPQLGHLQWVKGTYPTPYGVISVEARRSGDQILTDIRLPEGVTQVQ